MVVVVVLVVGGGDVGLAVFASFWIWLTSQMPWKRHIRACSLAVILTVAGTSVVVVLVVVVVAVVATSSGIIVGTAA